MTLTNATAHVGFVCLLSFGAAGCQLIADFDRSKIPTDAGRLPDSATSFDAGMDGQVLDGALDGELPIDAGDGSVAPGEAGQDAFVPTDDAGDDDAGDDDAG